MGKRKKDKKHRIKYLDRDEFNNITRAGDWVPVELTGVAAPKFLRTLLKEI